MKVAYISAIYFSDMDISLLHEMQKKADVYYFLLLGPMFKGAAVNIKNPFRENGIFRADEYPELRRFSEYLDMDKFYVINRSRPHVSSPGNLTLYCKLVSFLKKERFDIIHISDFLHYTEFPLFFLRNKMIISVHDPLQHSSIVSKRVELQRKILFKLIKKIVIFNESQKQEFCKKYGLCKSNILTTHLSSYNYLKAYSSKSDSNISYRYVLFFGQILSNKGLEYLFPAMKAVHEKCPDVKLIVAGKGKYYFDIEEYKDLSYFKIDNRFIPDEELTSLIKGCEFVVCPYNDATQSGVVMSAFAFGKPVVATNTGGLPEMVKDGVFGYIVPTRDEENLAEKMISLLGNPEILQKMSSNIFEYYESGEGSWKMTAEDLFNFYSRI